MIYLKNVTFTITNPPPRWYVAGYIVYLNALLCVFVRTHTLSLQLTCQRPSHETKRSRLSPRYVNPGRWRFGVCTFLSIYFHLNSCQLLFAASFIRTNTKGSTVFFSYLHLGCLERSFTIPLTCFQSYAQHTVQYTQYDLMINVKLSWSC